MSDVQTTALVGVFTALLVFLTNQLSSRRESKERQLDRKAEDNRLDHELAMKRLDVEKSRDAETIRAQEAAQQRERDRYLRFLTAAQDVAMHWKTERDAGLARPPAAELRSLLASSYEDSLLSAPDEVQSAITDVKNRIDDLASAVESDTNAGFKNLYNTLQGDMDFLRDTIREHFDR